MGIGENGIKYILKIIIRIVQQEFFSHDWCFAAEEDVELKLSGWVVPGSCCPRPPALSPPHTAPLGSTAGKPRGFIHIQVSSI